MIYLEEEIHIYYILYDLFDLEPPMLRTSHLLLHELIHSPDHLQLMVYFISGKIRLPYVLNTAGLAQFQTPHPLVGLSN